MNIYGFMIVKDEGDILEQTLQSLLKFGGFTKLFIYDNGSTDDTFSIAKRYASEVVIPSELHESFSDNLKYAMVYANADIFTDGDWFAILDGDELYQEPQRPVIELAAQNHCNCIEHNTVQFYFSEKEESYDFDPARPAILQRPHYLLNYGEPRIFQYKSGVRLTADLVKKRTAELIIAPDKLTVHHFQFRSINQLQKRIRIRSQNNKDSNNWGHINSDDWKNYLVPKKHLHTYSGSIEEGLPKGANLYKIRDNAAYTMANLNWLKKNHMLTPDQLAFFSANRWQRIMRKLW